MKIFYYLVICVLSNVTAHASTYRICNKTGSPISGALNYLIAMPSNGCLPTNFFNLQADELVDFQNTQNQVARDWYDQAPICCIDTIEYGNNVGHIGRKDACDTITMFLLKDSSGTLRAGYKRGLHSCFPPRFQDSFPY